MAKKSKREILLGITGGIAAYKACDIINRLRKLGYRITVVMTAEAHHFITPLTLQSLSGNKVFSDMFAPPTEWEPVHISLAQKAHLVVVAPCSANLIGKLASGICDDLLTCTILATKAKILLVPAMNENMYKNSIVQENVVKLQKRGYAFIGPIKGHLVCGTEGIGHLAVVDDIVKMVKKLLV